jgi:hypothetical protein
MGRPRLFDDISINPATPVTDSRVLSVYIVTDASKDTTSSSGCARASARKDEPLDDLSVHGGCVVVAIERMQIRCSADAVRLFDPDPRYRFGDCTYHLQLVPEGRAKARRVGAEVTRRGIAIGEVLSSEWCRARDSAQLMFARHETWDALNVMLD